MYYCLEEILKLDNDFQEVSSVILLLENTPSMGSTMIFSDLKNWHINHLVWKHGFPFGKLNENMPRAYRKQGWESISNKSKTKQNKKAQTLLEIQSRHTGKKSFFYTGLNDKINVFLSEVTKFPILI